MDSSFYGVFTTGGELEAVESTVDAAYITACQLSPTTGGKPPKAPVGRTVEAITIMRGDVGDVLLRMLALATDNTIAKLTADYDKQVALCTTLDSKTGREVVIANAALHDAKERLRTAVNMRLAL